LESQWVGVPWAASRFDGGDDDDGDDDDDDDEEASKASFWRCAVLRREMPEEEEGGEEEEEEASSNSLVMRSGDDEDEEEAATGTIPAINNKSRRSDRLMSEEKLIGLFVFQYVCKLLLLLLLLQSTKGRSKHSSQSHWPLALRQAATLLAAATSN